MISESQRKAIEARAKKFSKTRSHETFCDSGFTAEINAEAGFISGAIEQAELDAEAVKALVDAVQYIHGMCGRGAPVQLKMAEALAKYEALKGK